MFRGEKFTISRITKINTYPASDSGQKEILPDLKAIVKNKTSDHELTLWSS